MEREFTQQELSPTEQRPSGALMGVLSNVLGVFGDETADQFWDEARSRRMVVTVTALSFLPHAPRAFTAMDVLKEHPELAASVLKVLSDAPKSSQQQVQELERRLAEQGVAIAQNAGGSLVSLAEENERLRTDLDELRLKRESLSLKSDLAASVDKDKIEKLECDLLELRREYDQQVRLNSDISLVRRYDRVLQSLVGVKTVTGAEGDLARIREEYTREKMLKEKDAQIGQLQNDVVAPERNHQTIGSLVQASQHEVGRLADRVDRREAEYRDLHELLLDCDMVRETAVSTLRQENILLTEEKTGITEHALMVRDDL
ncbi:hypothetical protein B0H11DRAFT_1899544 [Mycena galericulata]|nr:hypothetical protein B0H11DRAFT_1899544 [Mycena galericulata]